MHPRSESFSLVLANLRKADSASSVDLGTLRTSLGDMDTTINKCEDPAWVPLLRGSVSH